MSQVVAPTPLDALWRSFRKLVRAEMPTTTFLGTYEYSVDSIDSGMLSAVRTDPTLPIPDVVKIPMRSGIPGATVKPAKGGLVYVCFANGDPSRPIAHSYDQTAAESVTFDEGTGTAEHLTTIEAMANLLLQVAPLIGPGVNTLTEATLATSIIACGTTSNITAITLTAVALAMGAKVTAGGDGTPPGAAPSVGCPNLRGG